jgi:hypothetical protein
MQKANNNWKKKAKRKKLLNKKNVEDVTFEDVSPFSLQMPTKGEYANSTTTIFMKGNIDKHKTT